MPPSGDHRARLREIARRAMAARGLEPEFPREALAELGRIAGPAPAAGAKDLRGLGWCSIDNDDSRDLDQLTAAEALPGGGARIRVAIADVDALVARGTALDGHARHNTTSVYAAGTVFPMLPERLSTDLTSLNPGVERRAMVAELVLQKDGSLGESRFYPAVVENKAKLAYAATGAWLDGNAPAPGPLAAAPGVEAGLRLQDAFARQLRARRHRRGALDLETAEFRPVFEGGRLRDLAPERPDRAKRLIEDLMVAANGAAAVFLASRGLPALRRVVREPRHWDRIVEIAAEGGTRLPAAPDAPALERFLLAARAADPAGFADLSLCVIKLLGPGEYVVAAPGEKAEGHFGLAVRDYAHSTAPNRRYPDLVTQRLIKAALAGTRPPYPLDELRSLALHCTEQEDAAKKVERHVAKSAAALLLEARIGAGFDAIATGASPGGTWVRIGQPAVEGRLVAGFEGVKVGDRVRVRLVAADAERGHIDFARA